jgi:hypothetical protein
MKTRIETLGLFLVMSAMCACADGSGGPVAPRIAASDGPLVARSTGAVQERGTSTFGGDGVNYIPCIGEFVHSHAEFPFRWHQVTTPSGTVVFNDQFIPNAGTGSLEGLTSGTVWTMQRSVSPEVIITNAGEHAFFIAIVTRESATGPTFTLHNTYHFVQNANGDVKVDRFESHCVMHS